MNRQLLYEWTSVQEIKETQDSIDIFTSDGSGVIVRDRAFETLAEKARFVEFARSLSQPGNNQMD